MRPAVRRSRREHVELSIREAGAEFPCLPAAARPRNSRSEFDGCGRSFLLLLNSLDTLAKATILADKLVKTAIFAVFGSDLDGNYGSLDPEKSVREDHLSSSGAKP